MDLINLINHQVNWLVHLFKAVNNEVVAPPPFLGGVYHEEHRIHLIKGGKCSVHHKIPQPTVRFMNPRRVNENNLSAIRRVNPLNFIPGCLRLITHNRNFLAHDPV